ncbi:Oidioi.mRNA.OKI2018_I69.XSR.g13350.t1.cds [Oikopleura dioica]|uniref:Oidioi.mRNA.OKI2018_I69.XSR.g13350.t1.cds n=1 Tax=Oikopleura dioica TaxID=34765 RepID=A0ABN7SCQ4_OIKDI|nr:Oidioi.mRNA.OKI2018_I69.XSR.g13350.t1.cds [Oikopleura dioica]
MQEHPRSVELSELILERMPMDVLTWIAPIVLEQINEDGCSNFDAMTSPLFCRTFLNPHYKRDTILELVGKELEAEINSKPDRLSDVMKIVQKRHDMKYNKKKLEPKATIEFKSSEVEVKFGRSFLFAWTNDEPQGLDLGAARSNLLLFKINRENEERSPKFELVDYHPHDPQQNPERRPFYPLRATAFLPPRDGVFLDSVVLSPDFRKRLFSPDQVTTEIVKGKKILLESESFEQMDFNFSRQRSWRDYVTNPKSVVPMIQEADLFEVHSSGDEEEEEESEEEISPFEKRVVDFGTFLVESSRRRRCLYVHDRGHQTKIPKARKRSIKINKEDDEETTLPTINLEDFRVPEYRDHSENLLPWQSDVGFVIGNKFHLLV